jgi:uncharacterized protein YicC (UPF0701 family)
LKNEFFFKTVVCNEYEKLLKKCTTALEIWDNRREEIAQGRLKRKEVGEELLRLQADLAKAYSILQRHSDNCRLCQFVSKIGGRESARDPKVPFLKSVPA